LERTENVQELAELYSAADIFLNPTLEEALGLTNLEAQACGTQSLL
jgi:glycosyltransferase involved in cell wall biosynthesis